MPYASFVSALVSELWLRDIRPGTDTLKWALDLIQYLISRYSVYTILLQHITLLHPQGHGQIYKILVNNKVADDQRRRTYPHTNIHMIPLRQGHTSYPWYQVLWTTTLPNILETYQKGATMGTNSVKFELKYILKYNNLHSRKRSWK